MGGSTIRPSSGRASDSVLKIQFKFIRLRSLPMPGGHALMDSDDIYRQLRSTIIVNLSKPSAVSVSEIPLTHEYFFVSKLDVELLIYMKKRFALIWFENFNNSSTASTRK